MPNATQDADLEIGGPNEQIETAIIRSAMTRRDVLAGLVATVAFRSTAWAEIQKLDPSSAGPDDEKFWGEVRKRFILPEKVVSFNHVGLAPTPTEVFDAHVRQLRRAASLPTQVMWREQVHEVEAIRERLAKLIGAKPTETALTYNATYGLQTGILGWPLAKGDAIVTSSHDYSRTFTAIQQRVRREGIEMIEVPVQAPPASKEQVLESWRQALKPNVKLVVLCTVTFLNGQILPVAEIVSLCRSKGIAVLVDGAQSIGLLPTDFAAWGPEMYTACLHKWLMAPIGTGVFAVRQSEIGRLWSLCPSEENLEKDIKKFEQVGTHPYAPMLAIGQALDFHEWLGMERKLLRLDHLRRKLAEQIFPHPNLSDYGSLAPGVTCAMLAIGFKKTTGAEATSYLMSQHGIHVTTVIRGGLDGIRISPNVFTSLEEVNRLAKAIRELADR